MSYAAPLIRPSAAITARSEPQIVVHRDLDILFRAKIALCRLDGGVPQEELDLLEIPAVLAAELGAGAAEVVGTEVFDPDLFG